MLTELEVKSKCLAVALKGDSTSFGANHAKRAFDTLNALRKSGKCDDETFARVAVFFGNHSAIRQWCVAHAFIAAPADALTNALTEELGKLDKQEREEMEKITEGKK